MSTRRPLPRVRLPHRFPNGLTVTQGRPGGPELDRIDVVHDRSDTVVGAVVQMWGTERRSPTDMALAMQLGDLTNATPTRKVRVWRAYDLPHGPRSGRRIGSDHRDETAALDTLVRHPQFRRHISHLDTAAAEDTQPTE